MRTAIFLQQQRETDLAIFTRILDNTWLGDPEGCWTYQRNKRATYPTFGLHGYKMLVHRWVHQYINTHDPLTPSAPNVLHWCDNKHCIKPDHLYAGDQRNNHADAVRNGRVLTRY